MRPAGCFVLLSFLAVACSSHEPPALSRAESRLSWSSGTTASTGRYWHASIPLADGRVLITGGGSSASPYASSAEIFDPATGGWSSAGAISVGRFFFGGGRLPSGKVLVAGGERDSNPSRVVDIFDPASGTWTVGPSLISEQGRSVMHRLPDGRLLLIGSGWTPEVFDESTGAWAQTGPLETTRLPAIATLTSGKILACGGYGDGGSPKASCFLFDPSTNAWTATGTMKQARVEYLLAPLPSGGAIAAGGEYGGPISSVEIWDHTTGTWSTAASMGTARRQHAGGALPDGKVLAAFGGTSTAEVFNPVSGTWLAAGDGAIPRLWAQSVTTTTGRIVFTGGMHASTYALIATPEVFTQQAIGATCKAGGDCASGFCVDGVCCNTSCASSCSACDLPGNVGTCSLVDGAAPHGSRSCAPFGKCIAGACVTTCSTASDCDSDRYCVSGACVPRKKNGLACSASTECTSGFCVDGVCCGDACTDQCAACDVVGSFGVCTPFAGQPRGGRAVCSGVGVGTICGQQCDGVDKTSCHYPSASIACGADSCADAIEIRAGACDGAGLCKTTSKSCGAYACSGSSCRTSCTTNSECASGNYCKAGTCIAYEGLGTACTTGASCTTGNCVDGVCCGSSSCASGATCASARAPGRCAKLAGSACTLDEECGTGFCVDSVCCDTRCDGQCEACDVAGATGVCTPVVGTPRGARAACASGDVCAARACDGVSRTSCAAYAAGPETTCSPPTCKGDTLSLVGKCDGAGACAPSGTSSCVPFACVGRACGTSCTIDAECAENFRCTGGTCVAQAAKCSDDGVSSIPTGGEPRSCAPYRCQSTGECGSRCESSSQCAPGAVCDLASSTCLTSVTAEDSGGCSMGRRSPPGVVAFALVALAALLVRRRTPMWALFAALTLLGCSTKRVERATALTEVRAHGKFAARLAEARVPGSSPGLAQAFPSAADGVLAMRAGSATVSVRALDVRAITSEVADGASVYANAAEETDLVLLQTAHVTEELRVLHGRRAPSVLRWALAGNVKFAVEGGRVVVRDANGTLVLQTEELDAVDARGVRRVARLSLERPLRSDGLESNTLTARFDLDGMTYPIVIDPAWSVGPVMTSERKEHAAVRLTDGRVLVTGGRIASTNLSTAEVYDPATNTFAAVAPMKRTHAGHAAVLLPNGTALVGGWSPPYTEIYDPATDSWQDLGMLPTSSGVLIGLTDGRVLAVGGCYNSLDVFDPATKTWSAGAPMKEARISPLQVRLDDGRVLVVGGSSCASGSVSTAEIYDPTSNTWSFVATPPSAFTSGSMVALPGKRALVTGGSDSRSSVVFDATTNTWTARASMIDTHYSHASELLPNGRVLVIGGQDQLAAEVWDPVADAWSRAGALSRTRLRYPVTPLTSGALLITGGLAMPSGTLSTSELFTLVPNGGSCTESGECNSGFCVSGVCCNNACTGTCSACDAAGKVGTCSPLDGDPHYGRTCTGGLSCSAGTCRTTCSSDTHCAAGRFCLAGACVIKKALGDACTTTNECVSGICVDGVCCDRACGAQCEACDLPTSKGTCTGVVGAPRGGRPACTGAGLGTACGPACDGKDLSNCTYAKTTTFCSATTCSAGIETHASFCDGAGACRDVPRDCGAYACGAFACNVTCSSSSDCAVGHYCKGSACTKIEDLGVACTSGAACKTGFCVDGACCATSSCDGGSTCAAKGREGTCSKRNGATCTTAGECGSGVCVDGVCCDRACDGQCEACDVTGSKGSCVAVVGAPHGARTACDAGSSPCAAKSCDGTDGKTCAAFASATVVCGTATCSGTTFSSAMRCDGMGACAPAEATSCTPYVCDKEGCLTSCTVDAQCADGFECRSSKCEARRARCSEDLAQSVAVTGARVDCAPYRCGPTGECLKECATSADCGGGHVCDGRACVQVSNGAPEESGGCAYGAPARAGGWVVLLVALGFVTRRRRMRL